MFTRYKLLRGVRPKVYSIVCQHVEQEEGTFLHFVRIGVQRGIENDIGRQYQEVRGLSATVRIIESPFEHHSKSRQVHEPLFLNERTGRIN